ncbi:MAG: tetratricopeptide repeat protein [Ignavibacteria bacterium]|nr:tetratricopeptide repeat protein [Ignavibacteria bacterium]
MKLEKNALFLAGFLAVSSLFSLAAYSDELPYEERAQGNYSYLNPFAHKPATPQAHWDYAQSLREQGKPGAARQQFEIFVKRWPESAQAAAAQQAVGDLYFEQGKQKKAFEAYETLIKTYYTGIRNYDSVLENQLAIADVELERKRMRWMFGGYTAPERAIPYLESILRNAPQWDRAPEMQYRIGEAYQKNKNYEMAIVAYTTVEYRYPDSSIAEQASFAKIESLRSLVRATPYSLDIREQAELAVDMFKQSYPNSEHRVEVDTFGQALYSSSARATYEVGEFYERVPKPPRNESARIYYEKVIEQYGGTEYAVLAAERLRVLFPGSVASDGTLIRPEIAAVSKEVLAEEGSAIAQIAESGSGVVTHPLPERLVEDPDAVEVTADRMEYQGDLLIAEGRVSLQQQGASLRADRVTVNHQTGEIIASGNIVMLREDNLWEGQELVYNYKTRQGTFGESAMYFDPVYVTAEKTERVSTNEYVMYNARITTCSGDKPLIYAKAKEVRVLDEDKASGLFIQAKSVTFYVGKVPVFYTPVWQRHLGYRIFTFSVGYGGQLGAFFMGRAELHPTDWLTANTHFDYYSARGLGLGQDFSWKTTNGNGYINTYYINDASPLESTENVAEEALVDTTRYRVRIGHHEQIDDETYFITQINYLSDPFILEDFFSEEFRANANPENYAVVQRATDEYAASVRVDHRLNDFYTTVDRLPELDFDWYRSQVADSPFYFQSDNSLGFLQMLHTETNKITVTTNTIGSVTNVTTNFPPSNYQSARFDTYNQIFLPLRFHDFYNVIPRAAYRGTWYSDTVGGSADYRQIVELGTLASFKAYKTLTEKSGYYGDGLRHIIEPYADYNYRYSSIHTNRLHQFDAIDALDSENRIRFGLRNFLQTKRGANRIVNFLDADIFTSYRFEPQGTERNMGPLEADVELSLTDHFKIESDFSYDWHKGGFDDFNVRAKYTTDDLSQYAFEFRHLDGERTLFTPSFLLFPNDDWSYGFYAQYDASLGEWRERKFLVNHKFDCLGMGLGIKLDEDDVPMIWVNFWLTAFPEMAPTVGR